MVGILPIVRAVNLIPARIGSSSVSALRSGLRPTVQAGREAGQGCMSCPLHKEGRGCAIEKLQNQIQKEIGDSPSPQLDNIRLIEKKWRSAYCSESDLRPRGAFR